MNPRRVLCCAVITALMTACGDPQPPATAPAPQAAAPGAAASVCGLLSADEITRLFGAAPAGPGHVTAGLPGCQWPSDSGLPMLQVTLAPNAATSADDYRERMSRELGEFWSEDDLGPVSGLGDFAFYTADARMLQVFRGPRTLQIIVARPAGEAEATAVARLLLAKDW